jgi:hypothetical protein
MNIKIEKQYWNDEEVFTIFASEGDSAVNIGEAGSQEEAVALIERFNNFQIKITAKSVHPKLQFECKTLLWNCIESKGSFQNNSVVSRELDWTGMNAYDVQSNLAIDGMIPKLSISDERSIFYYGYDNIGGEFDVEDREARNELPCFMLSDIFQKKMYWGMIR